MENQVHSSSVKEKNIAFINKPMWKENRTILIVWVLSAIIYAIVKYSIGYYNNFKIFVWVWHHALEGLNLYADYPEHHGDSNHYGILFSLIIAPFTVFPYWLGMIFWIIVNTVFLFFAIQKLPLSHNHKVLIYWFSLVELMTAQGMQQFNISVVAIIILAFVYIQNGKDFWAAALIMVGAFVKLYPIVGLAFFFFSRNKIQLVLSCIFWAAVCFVLPMIYTSFDYVVSQYVEWYNSLTSKNDVNMFARDQNISLLGFVRKMFDSPDNITHYSDMWLIIPALILFFIPYFRISQYKHLSFRLMLLANVLIFLVLFSTGSEPSGYISVMVGVAIWYICSPSSHKKYNKWLFYTTLAIVSIATTELVPPFIRLEFITPFVFKVWPCIIVWFTVCYEMIFLDFSKSQPLNLSEQKAEINKGGFINEN